MPKPSKLLMFYQPPVLSRQSAPAHSVLALTGFFLICYAVAGLDAVFTVPAIPFWYASLAKPAFNPPNGVFGPVWTALYGLMAIAAWLVWRAPRKPAGELAIRMSIRRQALLLFAVQLVLNALWAPLFFGMRLLLPTFVVILLLWIAIAATTLRFWQIDRFAATLMLPYLAWVGFAGVLNYAIYRLN